MPVFSSCTFYPCYIFAFKFNNIFVVPLYRVIHFYIYIIETKNFLAFKRCTQFILFLKLVSTVFFSLLCIVKILNKNFVWWVILFCWTGIMWCVYEVEYGEWVNFGWMIIGVIKSLGCENMTLFQINEKKNYFYLCLVL